MEVYVARKELDLDGRGKKLARIGEPVDVSTWAYPTIKAHVDLGWLEKMSEEAFTAPQSKTAEEMGE